MKETDKRRILRRGDDIGEPAFCVCGDVLGRHSLATVLDEHASADDHCGQDEHQREQRAGQVSLNGAEERRLRTTEQTRGRGRGVRSGGSDDEQHGQERENRGDAVAEPGDDADLDRGDDGDVGESAHFNSFSVCRLSTDCR